MSGSNSAHDEDRLREQRCRVVAGDDPDADLVELAISLAEPGHRRGEIARDCDRGEVSGYHRTDLRPGRTRTRKPIGDRDRNAEQRAGGAQERPQLDGRCRQEDRRADGAGFPEEAIGQPAQSAVPAVTDAFRAKRATVKAKMAVAARSGVLDAAVRSELEKQLTAASEPGLSPSVPRVVAFQTTKNFSNLTVAGEGWRPASTPRS